MQAAPDGALAQAYIPLQREILWVAEGDAGAVALGGGIAVTVAHAKPLVPSDKVIGTSTDYDLMFFRTDHDGVALPIDEPRVGTKVVSYAHYEDEFYRAQGTIIALDAPVKARCETCVIQATLAFDGNAGPGYSGGPVVDAQTGKLLGIVFGYIDKPEGGRTIYAYPMSRVFEELKKIQARKTS